MKAAELFIKCLENEGVKFIYGIPGEENLDIMDALLSSSIRFITTRHEQGAAFMADVEGRLTGKAGVCLSTLGPGATNLVTGVADANMDHAPLVAISGQAPTNRLHKESHQVLDLVNLFQPITKYASQILNPEIIPEVIRKAFKVAESEKPGASFIEFPENLAAIDIEGTPLLAQSASMSYPPQYKLEQAAQIISDAKYPMILAGNGLIRTNACEALINCAEKLNIPVATTFMAKGAIPNSHPLSLGTVGLQAHDYISCGFERADVIICIGYDLVEYPPNLWHKTNDRKIIHIDTRPAEVDSHYIVATGVIGDFRITLESLSKLASPRFERSYENLRKAILQELHANDDDNGFPVKPQRIIADLRKALDPEDIVICDVGAHKMWMARMFPCEKPNTCIISNGFASMGIAVPGAVAAKLCFPDRKVVAVTGDAGFLMNSQEIETALRAHAPHVILIWSDSSYGLIEWKQHIYFGRESHVKFNNPDFVKYAEAFGAKGYRINSADELLPTLQKALNDNTVSIIDCPVDYRENMKLTARLGEMICPI
ncbi:acetolactate synthase-1/2/3 large subunit [Sulfurirhabdus autotrophica]|uniref:Acetolactate synthase-1/2/3 large subunit n=1 Tax=Sulfurirhabdus autotrophica TaxID=1706046 RepID=A0A4R3XSS6_9PROT|nr:acetolactate synthase-1/2/3 large subunit [Sulfurirhabdus autotrophica]